MPGPATVLLVSNFYVTDLFSQVAARLEGSADYRILRYDDYGACLRDVEKLRDVDVLLTMHDFPLTQDLMRSMPNLRAVFSFVTGTEHFDEKGATALGVIIGNGQIPENFHSMAEATIMLMLAALYDLRGSEASLRENLPRQPGYRANMLMGKTVGLIGFGQIARAVAERLSTWKVKIKVYSPRLRSALPDYVERVEIDDLLQTSDVISVLANLNSESKHLLGEMRLRQIKPGAVLINTARGGLIDEVALYKVAREGRFKALALDTFEQEPLPKDSPLRDLPNAILTPHAVGHTDETHQALVDAAVDNIRRATHGVLPANIRNPDVIPVWNSRWSGKSTMVVPEKEGIAS